MLWMVSHVDTEMSIYNIQPRCTEQPPHLIHIWEEISHRNASHSLHGLQVLCHTLAGAGQVGHTCQRGVLRGPGHTCNSIVHLWNGTCRREGMGSGRLSVKMNERIIRGTDNYACQCCNGQKALRQGSRRQKAFPICRMGGTMTCDATHALLLHVNGLQPASLDRSQRMLVPGFRFTHLGIKQLLLHKSHTDPCQWLLSVIGCSCTTHVDQGRIVNVEEVEPACDG